LYFASNRDAKASAHPRPAVRGDQATVERHRYLLATDGWKIEGKKGIFGHGGRGKSIARVERRPGIEFLYDSNELN
jgi:hypothetical protein